MKKTSVDLIIIAGLGVDIVLNAEDYSTADLITLTGVIGRKASHLTIKNCNSKTTVDLMQICSIYPKNITLEF